MLTAKMLNKDTGNVCFALGIKRLAFSMPGDNYFGIQYSTFNIRYYIC